MGRMHGFGLTLFLIFFQVLALSGSSMAAFPLPPQLDNSVWEGKYDLATNQTYRNGSMVLTIASQSGSLFRGRVVLDSGEPIYFSGVMLDGEIRMTTEEGTICARLVFDRTVSSPVWKLTGYWQDTGYHYPDRPRTIWFSLRKK